jgi:hypothetical protein
MNTQRKVIVSGMFVIVGDYSLDTDYGDDGFLIRNASFLNLISDNFTDLEMDIMNNTTISIRISSHESDIKFPKNIDQYIVLDAPDNWAKI